jgi:hypothetical protein
MTSASCASRKFLDVAPLSRIAVLAAVLAAAAACSLDSPYVRVRVEMPTPAAVRTVDYREIVVAGFVATRPAEDVDLNDGLSSFFESELKVRVPAAAVSRRPAPESEDALKQEEIWRAAAGPERKVLFLAGKARFDQELRKALLESGPSRAEEPFSRDKVWEERKSFTLEATLMLIDGSTGRPIFEKEYKETATYANTRQPAGFALFDVLQRLKVKFFRDALGSQRIQERYLLYK